MLPIVLQNVRALHEAGKVPATQHGMNEVTVSPEIFRQLESEIPNPEQCTKLSNVFMWLPDGPDPDNGYWIMMADGPNAMISIQPMAVNVESLAPDQKPAHGSKRNAAKGQPPAEPEPPADPPADPPQE